MTICFVARAYIRIICFGRLLLEDWLIAASLLIYITCASVWQVYMRDMYNMEHAVEGSYTPGPTFIEDTKTALVACGVVSILVYIGLWLIKASFLVLFYRLGRQIRLYLYAWWACSTLVMACGVAGLGLNQYGCLFGDIDTIFATCMLPGSLQDIYVHEIVASLLDVISDVLSESILSAVYPAGENEKQKFLPDDADMLLITRLQSSSSRFGSCGALGSTFAKSWSSRPSSASSALPSRSPSSEGHSPGPSSKTPSMR